MQTILDPYFANVTGDSLLTYWGRVMYIFVGSDDVLLPGRHQAIIWTNAGILLIGPLETKISEILIAIQTFSFKRMHLKMSSTKWPPFCLGLNVLRETAFNTLRPRQNGRRFADDTFKCIFLNENVRISIKISLMFVPKGPINNIPALV